MSETTPQPVANPALGSGQRADVVLSGERVLVDTQWVESGRVRLRRQVITETRTVEVVLRREELIVETMNIAAADAGGDVWRGTAYDGPVVAEPAGEAPLVITLSQEVPEIVLYTEPYELVRVHRQWRIDYAPVTAQAAREQITLETAGPDGQSTASADDETA